MFIVSPQLRQYVVVITVNLMILSLGMDVGWTSPALVKLRDPKETPLSRPITEDEGGWIVSIGYIFCIFTLPCISYLVDHIGRKRCILIASLPKIIAGVMTIFAKEVWMLLVARAINLTMNTANTVTIMIYATEIASKEIRGSLGSIMSILSGVGVLLSLGLGPYVSYLNLNILLTAVTICGCIPLFFIPDTPFSLYNQGKIEEAKNVLIFFRGSEILAEEEIKEFCHMKPNEEFDKREIFKNKAYFKALVFAIVLGIGIQLNGFYLILFYLQTILETTETSVSPALSSVLIGLIQVLASTSVSTISDRFGRKVIIITTLLGMAVGMIGLGIFFALKQHGIVVSSFLNYLPLISIALITWCHSGGVGSQYLVLTTELLDDKIRAIGTSAGIIAATASTFLISRYTFAILSALGSTAAFTMFGIICIGISLFVYFFIPETKQKSIADIQRSLRGLKKEKDRIECVTRF